MVKIASIKKFHSLTALFEKVIRENLELPRKRTEQGRTRRDLPPLPPLPEDVTVWSDLCDLAMGGLGVEAFVRQWVESVLPEGSMFVNAREASPAAEDARLGQLTPTFVADARAASVRAVKNQYEYDENRTEWSEPVLFLTAVRPVPVAVHTQFDPLSQTTPGLNPGFGYPLSPGAVRPDSAFCTCFHARPREQVGQLEAWAHRVSRVHTRSAHMFTGCRLSTGRLLSQEHFSEAWPAGVTRMAKDWPPQDGTGASNQAENQRALNDASFAEFFACEAGRGAAWFVCQDTHTFENQWAWIKASGILIPLEAVLDFIHVAELRRIRRITDREAAGIAAGVAAGVVEAEERAGNPMQELYHGEAMVIDGSEWSQCCGDDSVDAMAVDS